jgi:peptidoglycan/xylan/chitin deacetylase (PgdA/CDA1 family)
MSLLPTRLAFLSRPQKKLMARGAAVLTYHKIGTPPRHTRDPFLYARVEEFDRQLAALRDLGFEGTRLGNILSAGTTPAKKFVVTFDDGFQNVFELGMDILSQQKLTALQFIVSDFIGKQNSWDISKGDSAEPLMDAVQIREWLAAGHEIGSHSATHHNLRQLGAAEAREEILGSKKSLEDTFGVQIKHFCYPFGGWTPAARDLVVEAGYQTGSTVEFGVNDAQTDRFLLRRIIPLSRSDLIRKIFHRIWRRF